MIYYIKTFTENVYVMPYYEGGRWQIFYEISSES